MAIKRSIRTPIQNRIVQTGNLVFVGGVIPRQDYDFLYGLGVKGIFGPGTPIPTSARGVLEHIQRALGNRTTHANAVNE